MFTSFDAAPGAGSGAGEFASAASPSPFVGRVETVAGTCTLSRGDTAAIALKAGDAVCQNDIIATAPDGRVSIRFIDGTSFTVADDARVVVKEFVCGGASPSARFDVVSGTFAFIAGDIAKAGKFEIDTAVASIRGRARSGGIGMLTLTALMFAVMEEARADSPGQAFLDDGTITYNGVFDVITKEAVPKHYVVDNPAESLVLQRVGSSVNADQTINSAQIMDQLHAAQQEALHIFSLGLAQGPTTTGPAGSGDPPLSGPPTFFQPINFTPPPGSGPPTGSGGPPNSGPPTIPGPLFLDVIFTPPPAAPGKINEIVGHTGDAAPDTTSSSLGLFSGPATVDAPTFAWSAGPLTSEQQTQLAAASTLTLSDSGGFINFQYSAEDKTFDFLAATETLTVTYNVTASGITQQAIITITGTNDAPMITSSAQRGAITEETNSHQPNPTGSTDPDHASGTVTFTDADLTNHHQVTVTGVVASGVTTGLADQATVLGWLTLGAPSDSTGGVTGSDVWTFSTQDKNFDYLAADETLTLTYTVQVDDGNGGKATQDVAITITGTNDTPVIASSTQAATITEDTDGAPLENHETHNASGTITFTDVDLSDHETSSIINTQINAMLANGYALTAGQRITLANAFGIDDATHSSADGTGTVGWHYSIDDSALDFLGANDVVTLTYTVQVDDGNGGTATRDVTITVHGSEDVPVISVTGSDSAAAELIESYKTLSTSGTLTVTDVDLSDTVTATIKGVMLSGTKGGLCDADVLGMLSVTSGAIAANPTDTHNLVWSFNSNPQTFGFLDAGQSLTLTYTVQVNDGHGGIADQPVTITVNGTDQPDLVTSLTGIDSHGYFSGQAPAIEHVSDGGVDVTTDARFQWQVLLPFSGGQWITVSTSNSFSQFFYEGLQLRVTATYAEAGGTDAITTYFGQISDNIFNGYGAPVRIQNLPNTLQVANGAALELAAATALAVFFPSSADAYGKLVIDDAGSFTGQIHNFAGTGTQSDAIDLRDIAYTSDLSLSYHDNSGHDTGGTLSILKWGHVVDTVNFVDGDYSVGNFALASDGHGGTIISDPPSPASDAPVALTAGTDTVALNGEAHSVTGTGQTVNNGDTISGSGADTVTIDSGNGDQSFTFGDGHHADVGMTSIGTLTLTDSAATGGHAIDVTFDSSFHNNGTLTVDGSALSHLDGANLTVDAHLATSDAFVFVGSGGADTLIGGAKADTIIGGGGGDTLTGGGGNDTFVFKAVTDSQPGAGHFDVITDFTHNADHLDFSAIDGLNSSVQAVNFLAGTSAPGSLAAHTIDIVTTGTDTIVYANASGSAETAGHVDMEIHLHNVTNVQSSDFILHG